MKNCRRIWRPKGRNRLRGYQATSLIELSEAELAPAGWRTNLHLSEEDAARVASSGAWVQSWMRSSGVIPCATLVLFDREQGLDELHGHARLALLQIAGDGFVSFDALFCGPKRHKSFAIVIQDHGLGGNYEQFGGGGLRERIAQRANCFPEWLLLGAATNPWAGYERVRACNPSIGGMHHVERVLMQRNGA